MNGSNISFIDIVAYAFINEEIVLLANVESVPLLLGS